ncbi:MAG: DNA polymerase III subunit delta [Candidatus Moranbacteria bacterium RIFOXYA12_FULL_44_15]|nr:MAG: DNA polymerase III subunit delta [Candidatus Moranbacteria bacterium RIFOXYA12_FULL_44_15]OGI34713.1 MAG: DNA polymerase III subunit delta [Candidatus Moranbacteria bacterium RIFOXYA2_FULL_43_15]
MIIFLYGDDSFRTHRKVIEIKQKYLQSDKSGSGLSSFDASEEKNILQKIREVFGMSNLFSSKRLLIVKNLISQASEEEQKSALEFLKKDIKKFEEDKDAVAVFWEKEMPKKNNALYKFLEKTGKKQNLEKLAGARLEAWILKRMKELDPVSSILKAALEKLVAYAGNETMALDAEIQKLVNYSNGDTISEKDVETLVRVGVDANIFATVDALGENNKKEALKLLHNHLEKGDDPFYLFSMFIYQFRNLLKIADFKERGMSNDYEISHVSKLHPFVVKKSLAQLRNFSFEKLKKIYATLLDIDVRVKTGKLDMKLALDKFVAEM